MKKITLAISLIAVLAFAEGYTTTESVKVTRSEPVYKTVTSQKPIRDCWIESEQAINQGSGSNDVIGGIVGGAIGGALGNQVGKGTGKTAATIGGAIAGAMIGQGASRGSETSTPRSVEKCKTRYESESQQVLSGYNNYGTYQGRQIIKFSDSPLQNITIHTNISY